MSESAGGYPSVLCFGMLSSVQWALFLGEAETDF